MRSACGRCVGPHERIKFGIVCLHRSSLAQGLHECVPHLIYVAKLLANVRLQLRHIPCHVLGHGPRKLLLLALEHFKLLHLHAGLLSLAAHQLNVGEELVELRKPRLLLLFRRQVPGSG